MRPALLLWLCAFLGGLTHAHAQRVDRLAQQMLVQPYVEQVLAARASAQPEQELAALEQGIAALGPDSPESYKLYVMLRQYHADRGNRVAAVRATEKAIDVAALPGQRYAALASLLTLQASLRDWSGVERSQAQFLEIQRRLRAAPQWRVRGALWEAQAAWALGYVEMHRGHVVAAQSGFEACLDKAKLANTEQDDGSVPFYVADCAAGLVSSLVIQGKLAEAGALYAAMTGTVEQLADKLARPMVMLRLAQVGVRIAVEQGQIATARRMALDAIERLQRVGADDNSARIANMRLQLAQMAMLEGDWAQALSWHEQRQHAMAQGKTQAEHRGAFTTDFAYALLRSGQTPRAMQMLQRIIQAREELFDHQSLPYWEARVFLGIAQAAAGQRAEAEPVLREAIPAFLALNNGERSAADAGVLRAARLNWVLDGYLQFLADLTLEAQQAGQGERAQALSAEAFRLADVARGSAVQRALAAAASRTVPSDPALAALARREQDLQNEMASLGDALVNLLARGRVAEQDKIVQDMRANLSHLRQQHSQVMGELQQRFPSYAALLDPKPVPPKVIQASLAPDEVMVSLYSGAERTLVWAVPAQGPVGFAVVPLGARALGEKVQALRAGLDAQGGTVPRFDTALAHELYRSLLAPVAASWQQGQQLIVVPHGKLGQLPFAVLLTEPWQAPSKTSGTPFSAMQEAPWLLKRVAISQLPSALTLPLLRQRSPESPSRAFIGFGDPVFSGSAAPKGGSVGLERRNLAVKPVQSAAPISAEASTAAVASQVDFSLLQALPDTAAEIQAVAQILQAQPARDIYLGTRASEHNVRQMDLRPYRVLMFATHGLIPGELPGLYQPALALSNPSLTGEAVARDEDGLLNMQEILELKLNADWVILSACNTAASNGKGDEAVSGLGRAFFYAGAKSLLLTQWPVETVSARLLTTETFRLQQQASTPQSRAQLLRQAALNLMRQSAGSAYSYAHPMFWAPYVLVGDGGAR